MTLSGFDPGHMGVAVESDSIGPQPLYCGYRLFDASASLERQSIDQVIVDRVESDCARALSDETHLFLRLDSIHRLLDARIEILNSQTKTAEAKTVQHLE